MTGLITPSKLLADNNEEWVTAPYLRPGYILVGVNARTLAHHQLKVEKRKKNRVKVEYILTDFERKPLDVIVYKQQFDCKRNKARFRLLLEDEWRDWTPIKEDTCTEIAKEKACQSK